MTANLYCSFCETDISPEEARGCKSRTCPLNTRTPQDALRESGHVQDSLGRWAKRA